MKCFVLLTLYLGKEASKKMKFEFLRRSIFIIITRARITCSKNWLPVKVMLSAYISANILELILRSLVISKIDMQVLSNVQEETIVMSSIHVKPLNLLNSAPFFKM